MMKRVSTLMNRETISYLIFGGLTTVLAFASFALAVRMGIGTASANTVSTVLAVLFAYWTNKVFVFQSREWGLRFVAGEFLKFCSARVVTFVLETALLVLLVDIFGFDGVIMKGLTSVLVVIGNYIFSKWIVFRDGKKNKNPRR